MSLVAACEEYLQGHHDSGLLLAAINEELTHENSNAIASILLKSQNEIILSENGWDLVTLFTHHVTSLDSPVYSLLQSIINVSSPKEMCLALLEQVELLYSITTFIILLPLLKDVLQRMTSPVSPLCDLRDFVARYCSIYERKALADIAITYKLNQEPLDSVEEEEEEEEEGMEEEGRKEDETKGITIQYLTESVITFLAPFVASIDKAYRQTCGSVDTMLPLQRVSIAHLLQLLGTVLISSDSNNDALAIMESIVMCHYGTLRLLEWRKSERKTDPEATFVLCPTGLTGFAHLILVDGFCSLYLPQVINPVYLFQVCSYHVNETLGQFSMSHNRITMNGLLLLERLIKGVSVHSLPLSTLDERIELSQILFKLCHLMYKCPFQEVRKECQGLLFKLINCFVSSGRYRMYKRLFTELDHSGVLGLLVHQIKEEVMSAIECNDEVFLGQSLYELYQMFLKASPQMDVLSDFDRLLAGLNFVRFLLLKDPSSRDQTYIWKCARQLKEDFFNPLRSSVLHLQTYCKARLQSPQQYSDREQLNFSVNVIGQERLPELTPEEETKTLQISLYRLDIILSVLARVEELASL